MTGPAGRLRIALVHPFHWDDVSRGGERYVADLSSWLAHRGHDVDVIVGTEGVATSTVVDGVRIRRIRHVLGRPLAGRSIGRADSFGLAALGPLLRRRYDVVHAMTPTAALAARSAGHRTLFTVLGHPSPEQYAGRPWALRTLHAAVRASSAVAAFSPASAEAVSATCGRPCLTLPLGVRLEHFPPNLGPRDGEPRLLFAGAPDVGRKGLDAALLALKGLMAAGRDARLLVPGERRHVEAAAATVGATDVLERVDALGPQPMTAMPALYRQATVSVLPARWEALGIALVESLASGTPIVCYDEGGAAAIPCGPDVGAAVPVGDIDALVAAIDRAITSAARPGTAARCVECAEQWAWSRIGPRHEQVYGELIGRRRRRREHRAGPARREQDGRC